MKGKSNYLGVILALMLSLFSIPSAFCAQTRNFTASGAITVGTRVTVSSTSVAAAGASDEDAGIAQATVADGEPVAVTMYADGEIGTYIASGAITAGVDVYPAASGKVSATIAGKRIGKALNATTTDGDAIKILKLAPAADRVIIRHAISASSVDDWIFEADRAYTVVSIKEDHAVAGSDGGAVTLDVRKITATATAPGAAAGATVKELLTAAFDLKSTANTTVTATLTATTADRNLAAGDKIGANFIGTLTALAGGVVIIELKAK